MCGIVGYYGFEKDENLLKNMNQAIAHRGPDGSGYYTNNLVGLGHGRLAIIDKKFGAQPIVSTDGNYIIIYNGEAYNYKSMRSRLEKEGVNFNTQSDSEVVLNAYIKWGEKSLEAINGMFGLAIYDRLKDKLIIARDHFGIKPVYYINIGTPKKPKILFASEIKALLVSGLFEPEPNDEIIYRYLKFRVHDDNKATFFKNVIKLEPGEMITIDAGGLESHRFSNLEEELKEIARMNHGQAYDQEQVLRYRKLLTGSIEQRLQSDVPVGTALSGGLDSSSVATIINQLLDETDNPFVKSVGDKQNTFSAIFPGSLNDEEKYVDACLANFSSKVLSHKIKPTAKQFQQDINDFVYSQEEPTISTGPYAQYCVMRKAKSHVKVLLDGQGADEIMAGYTPYYFVYLKQLKKDNHWLKLAFEAVKSTDILLRLIRFSIYDKLNFRKNTPFESFLNDDFKKQYLSQSFSNIQNNIKLRLIDDIFHNSLPSLLRYEDKNTMRFGIEGRVPFLDKDIVKFLFGLNCDAIIKNSWNKRILRDAMKNMLPNIIRQRRNKIGFTTPEADWFKLMDKYFLDIFTSEQFASRKYFNQEAVVRAYKNYVADKSSVPSMSFWRILNLELWLRKFIDKPQLDSTTNPVVELQANPDKKVDIKVANEQYCRYPIRTKMVNQDDRLEDVIVPQLKSFVTKIKDQTNLDKMIKSNGWYLFVSEKIVAITQKRSFFVWDIKPGLLAKVLSRFVLKTSHGIGLAHPCTMELAIREVGPARVIASAVIGFLGKIVGKKGLFYNLVGHNVRAIDGPTKSSVYPANVSAKLSPEKPDLVAKNITAMLKEVLPKDYSDSMIGTIIIDANDIGRNVLGKDFNTDDNILENIFADNPLGQAKQQTPLGFVFHK